MCKFKFLFYASIAVLTVLLFGIACTDDNEVSGGEEQEYLVFTKPCLQWGISQAELEAQMKAEGYSLTQSPYPCIYEGKRLERRIGYLFQNGKLCGASVAIPYDSIQNLNEITAAFPGAKPVDGYADTFLDVKNNFIVDYAVKEVTFAADEKNVGKYWIISWAQYDLDVAQAVDLGLSVKWANLNLVLSDTDKAANAPEEANSFFSCYGWGDPMGGKTSEEVSDYPSLDNISGTEYDIAAVNWGSNWRLPTQEEMQELLDQCTWTWTKRNDVKGYNIEGPSGESIFLPVTGYREGPDSGIDVDNAGYYWTGTLRSDDTNYPYVLTFGEGFKGLNANKDILRSYGCAIRPVQDK